MISSPYAPESIYGRTARTAIRGSVQTPKCKRVRLDARRERGAFLVERCTSSTIEITLEAPYFPPRTCIMTRQLSAVLPAAEVIGEVAGHCAPKVPDVTPAELQLSRPQSSVSLSSPKVSCPTIRAITSIGRAVELFCLGEEQPDGRRSGYRCQSRCLLTLSIDILPFANCG